MTAKPMTFLMTRPISPSPHRLIAPSFHFPALCQGGFKTVNSLPEKIRVVSTESFLLIEDSFL